MTVSVEKVRARFSSLAGSEARFDGPAGTQVPDSVVEAISRYLLTANANAGGAYSASLETEELLNSARRAAAAFLGAAPDDISFGANMSSLNFALSRAASRDWQPGDEVVVTALDHEANVAPWCAIAEDRRVVVRVAPLDPECRVDLDRLRALITERTRVVSFPLASNAVGTVTPAAAIAELAHSAGALVWVDAVHYAPHGPIDVAAVGCDVLLCSPYKFFGPHLGIAWVRRELSDLWHPYTVRPQLELPGKRFETGTQPHELLGGLIAAVAYIDEVGWEFIRAQEHSLGERFLQGLVTTGAELYGPRTMAGRVSTFSFNLPGELPAEAAHRLGVAGFAVTHGNFYALELFERLGLPQGSVRVGVLHTNTKDEVDQLLAALAPG